MFSEIDGRGPVAVPAACWRTAVDDVPVNVVEGV